MSLPFKYSCFVSYRHPGRDLGSLFISSFVRALREELDANGFPPPYWDQERLTIGTQWRDDLEVNLCQSVCMIAIVDRSYFSLEHIVCVQEFTAMQRLSHRRIPVAYGEGRMTRSLILPVCFRGFDFLPAAVKELQIEQFMDYEKRHKDLGKVKWAAQRIRSIATQVATLCHAFSQHKGLFETCDGFHFPDKESAKDWLSKLEPAPVRLPGR